VVDDFRFLEGKLLAARVYPEFLPLSPEWQVVNLGAGEGPQAIRYAGQYRRMIGVDVNARRLAKSQVAAALYHVHGYNPVCGDVERLPLPGKRFDAVLAIDIIEHVQNPVALCNEVHRLLRPDGVFLVTFPTMHDRYKDAISTLARLAGRKSHRAHRPHGSGWNPDAHNQAMPTRAWLALVTQCGFRLRDSRATTLFPPLHQYGVPRFWFSIDAIHAVDSFLCKLPPLKTLGQGLLCAFDRVERPT
jgi:SAM-dependent methyltransferase